MLDKVKSFLTTRCPLCRYRYGIRAQQRSRDRFLSLFFIYPFECCSCNCRFRALGCTRAGRDETAPRRQVLPPRRSGGPAQN